MSDRVISAVEEVTSDWLTEVLHSSAALTGGAVVGFDVATGAGNWSTNGVLRLRYSTDATGQLPASVFLKLATTGSGQLQFDDSEVRYYLRDYVDLPEAPLVECFDAAYSAELGRYHLLLADLTGSHLISCDQQRGIDYGLALAEAMADLHAHHWGVAGLATAGQRMLEPAQVHRFIDLGRPGLEVILEHRAEQLGPDGPERLRALYARHPRRMIERLDDPRGFALIHGDPNCTNIMVPSDQSVSPLYLIDRQPFVWSLRVWLGLYDIAYAIVLDWDIQTRRRLELPVLRRYHQRLLGRGVTDYGWDQLWSDYLLTIPLGAYISAEYCSEGLDTRLEFVWLPRLQRTLAAIEDHGCADLW